MGQIILPPITEQAARAIRLLWESFSPETTADCIPGFVWIEESSDPNFTPHLTLGTMEKAEAMRHIEYSREQYGILLFYYLHDEILSAHVNCVIDHDQTGFSFRELP